MDYDNTKHKIRTTYVKTNNNEAILAQISIVKNNYFVTNFKNNVTPIIVDNIAVNSNIDTIVAVELANIEESNIPLLKVIVMFSTTDGFTENSAFINYIPSYHSVIESTGKKYILRLYIKPSLISLPITARLALYISNERQF